MKVTMKLVAEKAGVSLSTVSRVLNTPESVDEEKVKVVRKWIKELNYQPNLAAQSLKKSSSFLIGVSIPNLTNPYFIEILDYLEKIATEKGYNLILHNSLGNPETEFENINNFIRRNVDGIILVANSVENIKYLKNRNIPHITLTNQFPDTNSISTNHRYGGKLVAKHFIEQGRVNLAYIGPENDEKYIGFQSELYEKGFGVDENMCIFIPNTPLSNFEIKNYIKKFLNTLSKYPDGFFTTNDTVAYELVKELEARDINIPKDTMLASFDNTILSQILKITSVNQPIQEIVEKGFEILLNQISEERFHHFGNFEILPSLVIRRSTIK
ncbi:LacI family DNA-binding transcriptional regulator [uncultured Cetobacterium sp.]|uniref:LacI family DNA-binding transcriptional regulator n=1 Tax=uncultured Cetobacterium sp. TaxID=527638 RepID=UPI0025D27222|nr:LacI family DNA-binding transcriptional regulator [uncultured Cetobacterium sp.]